MNAVDAIRFALIFSDQGIARLLEGMHDKPLVRPTSSGGNHPLWIMGHLCFAEAGVHSCITGEHNPVSDWSPLFAPGSTPSSNLSDYPPFEKIIKTFHELRQRNIALLEKLGEAGLERKPVSVPPGLEDMMRTNGQALMLTALHHMVHYGQLTDARRVAGLKPLM